MSADRENVVTAVLARLARAVEPFRCPRGCTSHHASDHQGACGHCGSGEDELCDPGCPVRP